MKPIETKIWRELELFAQAMQRGACVQLGDGNTVSPSGDPTGIHVSASVLRQYPIVKVIEPTVLRDWTAEDAKKHVGFAFRSEISGGITLIGLDMSGSVVSVNNSGYWRDWTNCKYAAPIPGTDPAKWDWKPCKVEVPVEKPEPKFDARGALETLVRGKIGCCRGTRYLLDEIKRIIKSMESP